ncbi:DUF3152 domain-containing protein [Amycolatopsis cihanbeyliensis]|uniref:DUF3152 domain-containing protein n=1 Tax=Amycolatopsis cihanbeyliensis TaxID=1128664 RepID=UPI0011500015|nr:DUF3152 domain-containing protein [Amycolatopsis cihanbeyliensis]
MDRVTHGARGDGQRAQSAPLPRRSPRSEQSTASSFDDRYRPGLRRTTAEPLRASWRPKATEEDATKRGEPRRRSKLSKAVRTYGWRVYALPVLLVLTALVVYDTANSGGGAPAEQQSAEGVSATGGGEPVVTENRAEPVGLDIPTAELPEGGDYTQAGKGTWHVVPVPEGRGEKVGTGGELYTYAVAVEDGIDPASYAGDDSFANSVEATLSDPRSWVGSDEISVQRVDNTDPPPDFTVSLTSPETTHRPDMCGFTIKYESSCNLSLKKRVVINLARWVRGGKAFNGAMTEYRQYAINHEVGHAFGNGHEGCPANDELAPVMMQQTFGVSNDYVADLNKVDPSNYSAVPADGKVCQPNAWPNPQAE